MTQLTILIAIIALAVWPATILFVLYRQSRLIRKNHRFIVDNLTDSALDEVKTPQLVKAVLQEMGCQPQENAEGHICFKYQGEDFYIASTPESRLITVWNPWWGSMEADNEALTLVKEIINLVNIDSPVITVYTGDEEQKCIGFHSKCHLLFSPKEAALDEFLTAILDHFFTTHATIKEHIQQLASAPEGEEKEKRVRVKGFAAYRENAETIPVNHDKTPG